MSSEATSPAYLERALRIPFLILDAIAYFALAAMLILTTLEVVLRSLFGLTLEVSEELSAYSLVVLLFCSAPRAMLSDSFLRVDIFYRKLKGSAKYAVDALYCTIALGITGIYIHRVYFLVESSFRRENKSTTLLETPLYIPQIVILIGFAGVALALVALLAANIKRLGSKTADGKGGVQ